MCGITGYIGEREAVPILLDGLRRLEYRGYDSAGVAVANGHGVSIVRAEGKLKELSRKLDKNHLHGRLGIGHTRWATHGRPSERNAHPHKAGPITLVHNGIIENYQKLRDYLTKKGHTIKSETDTEIVCHLIQQRIYEGLSMREAFVRVLGEIQGSYALVVLHEAEPDRLYVARFGSPLVIGLGEGENFVASDVPAFLPYTKRVLFLDDHQWGIIERGRTSFWNQEGKKVTQAVKEISWDQTQAEKGGYPHYMLKEIFEQPRVVGDTLADRIIDKEHRIRLEGLEKLIGYQRGFSFNKLYLIACGTSYHAALAGKYLIEEMARIPVLVDQASEFRYRRPIIDRKTLLVAISQSGETADTLAAVKEARTQGAKILSICNVLESSIPRASHLTLYTRAGPEIGVASTKAFTTQLSLLILLAFQIGKGCKQLPRGLLLKAIPALRHLPQQLEVILRQAKPIEAIAKRYAKAENFLYFARGINYPIALEGALKLKEISYIHAEGYSAGEMKHGPIALIDKGMPVVVLAPRDQVYDKVLSNIEEVKARGARVIAVGEEGDEELKKKVDDFISIPVAPWYVTPLLMSVPLQLLAYYIAVARGTDVDQPRNLAKSVTVE